MKRYTPEQRAWIADIYLTTKTPIKEIGELFNDKFKKQENTPSIKYLLQIMGLRRLEKHTTEQKKWLADIYLTTDKTTNEILKLFNEKFNKKTTKASLVNLISRMNIRRLEKYTKEQKRWIVDKHENTNLTQKVIADMFNKKYNRNLTVGVLQNIVRELNATPRLDATPYTKEQKEWFKKTYKNMSRQEIAILFNEKFGHVKKININSRLFNEVEPKYKQPKRKKQKPRKTVDRNEQKILDIYLKPKKAPTYQKVADIYNQTEKIKISKNHVKTTVRKHLSIRKETATRTSMKPKWSLRNDKKEGWKIREKEGGKYIPLHIFIYEYMFEKLKEDEIVIFIDGNKENFELDNLVKVDRRIFMSMWKQNINNKGSITKAWVEIKKLEYEIAEMIK